MTGEHIAGNGWVAWVSDGYPLWMVEMPDGDQNTDIYKMISSEFSSQRVLDEYLEKFVITHGNRLGPLYEDVVEFLKKWGVAAKAVNVTYEGEGGPAD
jgi:hypothetical protein